MTRLRRLLYCRRLKCFLFWRFLRGQVRRISTIHLISLDIIIFYVFILLNIAWIFMVIYIYFLCFIVIILIILRYHFLFILNWKIIIIISTTICTIIILFYLTIYIHSLLRIWWGIQIWWGTGIPTNALFNYESILLIGYSILILIRCSDLVPFVKFIWGSDLVILWIRCSDLIMTLDLLSHILAILIFIIFHNIMLIFYVRNVHFLDKLGIFFPPFNLFFFLLQFKDFFSFIKLIFLNNFVEGRRLGVFRI